MEVIMLWEVGGKRGTIECLERSPCGAVEMIFQPFYGGKLWVESAARKHERNWINLELGRENSLRLVTENSWKKKRKFSSPKKKKKKFETTEKRKLFAVTSHVWRFSLNSFSFFVKICVVFLRQGEHVVRRNAFVKSFLSSLPRSFFLRPINVPMTSLENNKQREEKNCSFARVAGCFRKHRETPNSATNPLWRMRNLIVGRSHVGKTSKRSEKHFPGAKQSQFSFCFWNFHIVGKAKRRAQYFFLVIFAFLPLCDLRLLSLPPTDQLALLQSMDH